MIVNIAGSKPQPKLFVFGDKSGDAVRRILALAEESSLVELLSEKPGFLADTTKDKISSVLLLFWAEISESFPEMTSATSLLEGEDSGAMALWLTGSSAGYPVQNILMPLPGLIDPMRVFEATQRALIVAGGELFGRGVNDIPEDVLAQMYSCTCHLIHYNIPDDLDQTDGWFDILMYRDQEDWDSFRASSVNSGVRTFKEAVALARSRTLSNYYEVAVSAEGEHVEFERGERVFQRNYREIAITLALESA